MGKYKVVITAELTTSWEAENADHAVELADDWVGEEYGNLKHKANYSVSKINE